MYFRRLRRLALRTAGLFNGSRSDREFRNELESHLQMHIDDNVRAGMSPEEAQRQALIRLGGVEATTERYRSERGLPLVETAARDLRFGARMLAKAPGFTAIAILSLAIGVGANTAIFSLFNTGLLRPLPIEQPNEMVSLNNLDGRHMFPAFSYPNYKDFRDRNNVFAGLIAYRFAPIGISYGGINERSWGYLVSGNYFEVLGVRPTLGRLISVEDDRVRGAHPVTVLSHRSWQDRFGGDPNIVGNTVVVNGRSYEIIGVAAPGFLGTEIIAAPELWFPMAMAAQIDVGNDWLDDREVENIFVQGRLEPGVSREKAQTNISSVALDLEREYPDENEGKRVMLTAPGLVGGVMRDSFLGFTGLLMVVVGFVLLLACTNLANLLLARATARRKEIAVRLALGASRLRVTGQLMAESMLLAGASGCLGLLVAFWLVSLAEQVKPPIDIPFMIDLHIDYRVLFFTVLTSVATGLLFGLLPAFQATKVDLISALKDKSSFSGSRISWWKNGLIVLQVALSLLLLVGGGLTLRALQRAQALDLGFKPEKAVEVSFDLRLQGYSEERGREFQERLLERISAVPNVRGAGTIDLAPVDLHFARAAVFIKGQSPERQSNAPRAMTSRISPGYLRAMDTRLIEGRDFNERDNENGARVAIVNETFARRFWPGEDAIGKRFSVSSPEAPLMEIVGVIQDGKYAGLYESPQPYFCRPVWQKYSGSTTLIARTDGDEQTLLSLVRDEIRQLDPQLPISAKKLTERLALPLLPARVAAWLLGVFGTLALILAAIGIYGVMSYAVSRRTHEIGVRVALGARESDVLRLTIGQGMKLALIGMLIGLAASLGLMQIAKSFLLGVSASDPLTYAIVTLLLMIVALAACFIPARRATKTDPMIALRNE